MHPQSIAPKRLAIVPRVSTEDQEQYGTSLEEQEEKLRLLAKLQDYVVPDDCVYSGDESGCLPLEHRAIIQRLLADARAHQFDAVAFHKLDRMARRLKYMIELWDKLEELGLTVLILDPMIDTSTAVGRLIRNVLGAISEFEVDTILERTMAGQRRKVKRGEHWLARGKYGYTYTRVDHATHTPGRIATNVDAAPVVRRIFERRAARVSFERIAIELTADGIAAPEGKGPWSDKTVARIVRDPAYKGEGKWYRRVAYRTANGKRGARQRGDGSGLVDVPFPAIVDPALWQVANDVDGPEQKHPVRTTPDKFLLHGGMVRCHEHGMVMVGSGSERPHPRYMCTRHLPTGKRVAHTIWAHDLDDAVWYVITEFLDNSEGLEAAMRERAAKIKAEHERAGARIREVARDLAMVEEEGLHLLRVGRETKISPALLEASMAEVTTREAQLRRELQVLAAQEQVADSELEEEQLAEELFCQIVDQAPTYTPVQKRALLELLHVHVSVDGHDFTVEGHLTSPRVRGHLGMHTRRTSGCALRVHPLGFRLAGALATAR